MDFNTIFLVGTLGLAGAFCYKYLVFPFSQMNRQRLAQSKVGKIMDRDGLSFEDARDKLLAEKIGKVVEIERNTCKIAGETVKQGDRLSFYNTDDKNFTIGDFVGAKTAKAEGYTEHICLKTSDNKLIYLPVEIIDTTTLKIYVR